MLWEIPIVFSSGLMQPLFTELANLRQKHRPSQWAAARLVLLENQIGIRENDELQIAELERTMNDQMTKCRAAASWSFVICRSVLLMVIAQMCCSALAQAQTPNMTGTWNVEITLGNAEHRLVRFDAQADGKGTLMAADPQSKVWGAAKPSEATWTRGEGNSVTFSGPVEFLLGNVGRDAGTLTCKGKFETADLISGEVEFSPLVGERPSKHGTFKAVRSGT
jgi:hypothetical protein